MYSRHSHMNHNITTVGTDDGSGAMPPQSWAFPHSTSPGFTSLLLIYGTAVDIQPVSNVHSFEGSRLPQELLKYSGWSPFSTVQRFGVCVLW